jgi:hypothetical protein
MNVAGIAAEAGGDATAVSECGIQFPVADVTGQRESLGERVVISGLPRRDDVPIRLERNREGVCGGCLWAGLDGGAGRFRPRIFLGISGPGGVGRKPLTSICGAWAM